jgi:hypothetical protein
VALVIGDWTPAPTVVCVSGYAREGLPLCDGERNAVARAPPVCICEKRMGGRGLGLKREEAVLKGEGVNCCWERRGVSTAQEREERVGR